MNGIDFDALVVRLGRERDEARAEVARLREALTEVAACSVDPEWERYGDPHADLLRVVLLARAALDGVAAYLQPN